MLGPQDLWIALALGVFSFGSKKLPELSRSLGQAMTEFKKGLTAEPAEIPQPPPALPPAQPSTAAHADEARAPDRAPSPG